MVEYCSNVNAEHVTDFWNGCYQEVSKKSLFYHTTKLGTLFCALNRCCDLPQRFLFATVGNMGEYGMTCIGKQSLCDENIWIALFTFIALSFIHIIGEQFSTLKNEQFAEAVTTGIYVHQTNHHSAEWSVSALVRHRVKGKHYLEDVCFSSRICLSFKWLMTNSFEFNDTIP